MKLFRFLVIGLGLAFLAGCGNDSSTSKPAEGSGRLSVYMTDGPVDPTSISHLYITFDKLFLFPVPDSLPSDTTGNFPRPIHLITSPVTFDILQLTNGLAEALGSVDLPVGHYRAVVLDLAPAGAWLVEADGDTQDVFVPTHRLFIPTDIEVVDGQETEVVFDFDVASSLHLIETGSGRYILRPVVRPMPNLPESASIEGGIFVQTDNGLVSAGSYMVANPRHGRPGRDQGNGNRPPRRGDPGNNRPAPADTAAFVPLTVAWPMFVHAAVVGGDSIPEGAAAELEAAADPGRGGPDLGRPHPRGTVVRPAGGYLLWRLRKDATYNMVLHLHPRSGFEVVSGPGTVALDGDKVGQDFVIQLKPPTP